jgi:rare lipoprotein A
MSGSDSRRTQGVRGDGMNFESGSTDAAAGASRLRIRPQSRTVLRVLTVAAIGAATANCGSQKVGRSIDPKYGVAPSPRVVAEGDPVPKGGGRELVGRPYVVAGRTYVPQDVRGYVREGLASWYGTAFHGRLTANGEVFDRYSIAAAHPTMPLPSYARVTNLRNSRSIMVRVNDRGPYHGDRIMDVSERVAEALDFKRSGTARVRVEYVGKASLRGSDDRKLLATLEVDGRPATFPGAGGPVMVAEQGRGGAPQALAFRSPQPGGPQDLDFRPSRAGITGSAAKQPLDLATIPDAATPVRPLAGPVAQLPPQRLVQAGLFFADPAMPPSRFTRDDPFKDMKPQRFVALKGQL